MAPRTQSKEPNQMHRLGPGLVLHFPQRKAQGDPQVSRVGRQVSAEQDGVLALCPWRSLALL